MRASGVIGTLLAAALLVGCSDPADEPDDEAVPQAAADVMAKPAYSAARWLYYFADQETGEVLAANRPDEMVFTASTAKNFTVGTVYDAIGPDTTLTTPVHATAAPQNGSVPGLVTRRAGRSRSRRPRGDGRPDGQQRSPPPLPTTCTVTSHPMP